MGPSNYDSHKITYVFKHTLNIWSGKSKDSEAYQIHFYHVESQILEKNTHHLQWWVKKHVLQGINTKEHTRKKVMENNRK